MSQLKDQLRKLLPKISQEANQLTDRVARSRWMLVRRIVESEKTVSQACRFYGCSEDFFRKWGRRIWRAKSVNGVVGKSRRPWRSPNRTPRRVERKVVSLRKFDPSQGPDRIAHDMQRVHRITIAPSTIAAILKREKLVSWKLYKTLTKRHMKRYRRPFPGYLQMDFKYVPYRVQGKQLYQLSCVDHHSSWRMIRIYDNKNTESVKDFLDELDGLCPFFILEIQTDNDTAFTDRFSSQRGVTGNHPFDFWCRQRSIRHRLIPVGQKELNGKVENTHKQDDREFYARGTYSDLLPLRRGAAGYELRWNTTRRTRALGFRSPLEVLDHAIVRALVYLSMLTQRADPALYMIDANNNAYLPTPKISTKKNKIRTRRKSQLQRYLDYLDWEETRKKLPMVALVPPMSDRKSVV